MKMQRIIYFLVHLILVVVGFSVAFSSHVATREWLKSGMFAVGTAMGATGFCGMVLWVYIAISTRSLDLLRTLDKSGLQWIYPIRAAQIREEYAVRLSKAKSRIDILGFGLKDFRRDYINDLESFSERAVVRILVLNPDSSYASQRDREEKQSDGIIRGEVEEFISQFRAKYGDNKPKLSLKKYSSLPGVNIFRIDGEIFWGPYLVGRASSNTLTMRVEKGGYMFNALEAHFEAIWKDFSEEA